MQDKREQAPNKSIAKNPFRTMFGGKSQEAIPFLAGTLRLAARIEQVGLEHLLLHPEQMSKALFNTKQVMGTDMILIPLSSDLSLHQDRPLKNSNLFSDHTTRNMLEVIHQLKAAREYVACSIPGPISMAMNVFGQEVLSDPVLLLTKASVLGQEILEFLRIAGETRPDLILIQEEKLPELLSEEDALELFEPIFASISYYSAQPLLSVSGIKPFLFEALAGSVKGILLTRNSLEQFSINELSGLHQKTGVYIGLELPEKIYFEPADFLKKYSGELRTNFEGRGVFAYSSDVPFETPVEHLRIITQTLRAVV